MEDVGSLLLVLELDDKFDIIDNIVRLTGYFEQTASRYVPPVAFRDHQTPLSNNEKNIRKSLGK